MGQVNAHVIFEAADAVDAEAKIMSWTLHDGCSVIVSSMPAPTRFETDESGTVRAVPEEPLSPPPSG